MEHLEYGDFKARLSAALSHFLATVARVFGQVILLFDRRRNSLVELFRHPARLIYGQRGLPRSQDHIFGASSVRVEPPR